MKTIDKLIMLFLAMYSISACVKTELVEESSNNVELTATMEYDAETKTSLSGLENGMYYPLWSAGDEIAVFVDDSSKPSRFVLNSGEGSTVASFAGTEEGERYVALYPYDMAESLSDGTITMTLPQTQEYLPDSFGQGSFPMIATGGSDGSLKFMNLCSVLKISLTGTAAVRNVKLTANDENTFMSGPSSVKTDYAASSEIQLSMSAGGFRSVVLDTKGLEISEDSPADVFIVIPSQTYAGGFTIDIDTYTDTLKTTVTSDITFERSQIRAIKELALDVNDEDIQLVKEKAALIALYDALDGDNWYNKWGFDVMPNENWCTDLPLDKWNGITTNQQGYVTGINLSGANLTGTIPDEIGSFKYLNFLGLDNNNITGEIPLAICDLCNLEYLLLFNNKLEGNIPKQLHNFSALKEFRISNNRLSGSIPKEIGYMKELEFLQLGGNLLSGELPDELYTLKKLKRIQLAMNQLSGEISSDIGELTQLEELLLEENRLVGTLPESLVRLTNLKDMKFFTNNLSGVLPESFYEWDFWKSWWGLSIMGNNYKFEDLSLPGPEAVVVDVNGKVIDIKEQYAINKYTILFQWASNADTQTHSILPQLKWIYESYSDKGVQIIGWANAAGDTLDSALSFIEDSNMLWDNFYYDNNENTFGNIPWYPSIYVTTVTVVDSTGRIVFSDLFDRSIYERDGYLEKLLMNDFNIEDEDHYISSDYSSDGTAEVLQTATQGNGINVVLLGDGYSDRQIADGTYAADMEYAYNSLFTIEPYRPFRDMFNVSYVNVVSATEGYDYYDTALDCGFGDGTYVYGDNDKCISYALNVVEEDEVDETLIVVVMNSGRYAGTCHMFYPADASKDYGSGVSVAYFPKGTDQEMFAQLLHHEANGHGFAKLADEYAYEDMGEIPSPVADDHRRQQNDWGWWKNVDFTSDVTQVRWANFIEDERYVNEGLGAYEGGLTYWSGVWRPTQTSIMVDNTGVFNAPSREAIYYRIHKLAYGDDWEYDYEKFLEYDAINRSEAAPAPQKRRANYVEKQYEPLHPPVVVGKTWREAR